MSTLWPRRRRDSSPRSGHVAAAASPRLVSTECQRRGRPRLVSTECPRRPPRTIGGPGERVGGTQVFFFVFNSLGLLPAVNAALLLPGAKAQRPLPAAPFVASAFFAGFGGLGPYLILREPRPEPVARSDLGFFPRYVSESRLYGLGLLAGAVGLYVRRAELPLMNRGDAAAATRIFRGDETRRRHGCDVDIPRRRVAAAAATWIFRRVAATPRLRLGYSAATRGDAGAAT